MRKEIEVYNAFFGDCIILKDKDDDSNLLVDFGVHEKSVISWPYKNRQRLTDSIANDISSRYSNTQLSLLITHFHLDHVSGLLHMYKNNIPACSGLFKKIYIANIWNNPFSVASNLFEEMLLTNQLQRSHLPRTNITLFDLLSFFSSSTGTIKLLSRGDIFEDGKYIALWPKKTIENKSVSELANSLDLPAEFYVELTELAKMVCVFVIRVLLNGEYQEAVFLEEFITTPTIEDLENRYINLANNYIENINNLSDDDLDNHIRKLNELNHKYNIVFQNKDFCNENVLFTGDAEQSDMSVIANDKDIPLHQSYKYIKIPHHGTDAHFFDFSSYNPQYIVITNGKVKVAAKLVNSYKIGARYGSLAATHICANSNNCCNCTLKCSTTASICKNGRILVYNNLSRVI